MPNPDIDYSNTIFYKIQCKNPDVKDLYIGHTTNFVQRKYAHKRSCIDEKSSNYNCKVYNVIRETGGWNNWKMEIIAFHNCENHYAARKLEQQYFEQYMATLNSIEPLPKLKTILPNNHTVEDKILECEPCNVKDSTAIAPALDTKTNKPLKLVRKNIDCLDAKSCNRCNYTTIRQSQYNRHIMTAKHKMLMNPDEKSSKITTFECRCGKVYKHMSSLCSHKKLCMHLINAVEICTNPTDELLAITVDKNKDNSQIVSIMEILIKENKEFKKIMIEQNSKIMEMAKELVVQRSSM
jgi:hypothetical protein